MSQGTVSINAYESPLGYETISAATMASAATLQSIKDNAKFVILQADGGDLYFRDDGTAPTTSSGMRLKDGVMFVYTGPLAKLKFIIVLSSTGKLNVSYYG